MEAEMGGLFQQIIQDMKNGTPLFEDFITKATKLHSSLKATILAVTAYLDSFQKIADSATNARGATRDIGTALTRICLRQKAVENRLKNFTSVIMECLILPLQEKLEEWKKIVVNLDKDHTRDFKRARAELKKRSTDTLRLQKKVKKGVVGGDVQKRLECGLQDVNERRHLLDETEKHALRAALIEERTRFCSFVSLLKPVVNEEIEMLSEMSHLQESIQQLEKHTSDPRVLPAASEQVIADLKASEGNWTFRTPPSSPSSLGSRKSSMCSISSINSSSSSSSKSHHSPWQRSLSQPVGRSGTMRFRSISSQDSGFMSQDTLFLRPPSAFIQVSNMSEQSNNGSDSSSSVQFEKTASAILNERPHTISSAYEKGNHQRPPLTVYTFHAPEKTISQPASPIISTPMEIPPKSPAASVKSLSKPPLPMRCSSLERPNGPNIPSKTITHQGVRVLPTNEELSIKKPSSLPAHLSKNAPQPHYANMHELMSGKISSENIEREKEPIRYGSKPVQNQQKPPPPIRRTSSISSASSMGSLDNLPPPPAFLLEPKVLPTTGINVAETVKVLTELNHTPASPNALRRHPLPNQNQFFQTQNTQMTTFQGVSYVSQCGGVVYAQPMGLGSGVGGGGGGSPSAVRRIHNIRSQSADRKSEAPGGVTTNFLASLTSKLSASQLSPKASRRISSDDRTPTNSPTLKFPQQQQQQKSIYGPGQSFLDSLNAKLSQQQICNQQTTQIKANKIRQYINSKAQPDPKVCHESLMDQIKRGAKLKRAKSTNDRSAPKIC